MTDLWPVRARRTWLPTGLAENITVDIDVSGRVHAVRASKRSDGVPLDGLLVPGLVNGHCHLELSALAGRVPRGGGFLAWGGRFMALRATVTELETEQAGREAARRLRAFGVGWVCDISNGAATAPWLKAAGLDGVVQHELLGFEPLTPDEARSRVSPSEDLGPRVRPTPHAVFSSGPELLKACVESRVHATPASIHIGEAEHERRFLVSGDGPHADLLDRLGRPWRWWAPPGVSPVHYLDQLGVLGPDLLLVHGIHLDAADQRLAATRGAPLCVCPRSNRYIGGRLPDVGGWLAAGGRLVIGTDSLASCEDLDVLREIPVLSEHAPEVPAERWLAAVTHEAADSLRVPDAGVLGEGRRPGLLLLDAAEPSDLTKPDTSIVRRWIRHPEAA